MIENTKGKDRETKYVKSERITVGENVMVWCILRCFPLVLYEVTRQHNAYSDRRKRVFTPSQTYAHEDGYTCKKAIYIYIYIYAC